jgi:YD repeat-containing protein
MVIRTIEPGSETTEYDKDVPGRLTSMTRPGSSAGSKTDPDAADNAITNFIDSASHQPALLWYY